MSNSVISGNLFTAAKQLADSEIQLIQAIENSRKNRNKNAASTMSTTAKKNLKKPSKSANVRPSAALIAAKHEAAKRQTQQGKRSNNIFVRDIYQKALDAYNIVHKDTGLVFDRSAIKHECCCKQKCSGGSLQYIKVIQRCEQLGLINRCKFIESRFAIESDILMKYNQKQIDKLKLIDEHMDTDNMDLSSLKCVNSVYKSSLLAVGGTINLIESIFKGDIQNGMAFIRPPTDNAAKSDHCDFYFFNNIAIAVEKALRSNWANKILIVDWDLHHQQTMQEMFYNNPQVVYFSIHRYDNGQCWPNLRESNFHFIGEDLAEGFNFNVALNKAGLTNSEYLAIFQQVLLPMAYEFQPDLVIVSAGYDAALGGPEGGSVTPACYAHLLSSLLSLASGKVAVILESGYCIKSSAECAALTLRTLLGDPCPLLQPLETPSQSIREAILNIIYTHKPYWKCYQYQDMYSINSVTCNKEEIATRHLPAITFKGNEIEANENETRNCYTMEGKEVVQMIEKKLNTVMAFTSLFKAANRVCVVYDDRMLKHYDISDGSHPEKPNRISGIYKKYEEHDLLNRCFLLKGRSATIKELLLIHAKEYVDKIKETENLRPKELQKLAMGFNSIYLHPETWPSACISAGSLLQVVDSVLNGESQSGVAIVRPPGHHAEEDAACGFCIFNNIAIAAKYALEIHHLQRVLIVDWDVHHGNGTQSAFENDSKVLYISVHRYDNGSFFPNSKQANYTNVGSGVGEGFNVNIPWNKKGMGDAEYIAAFQQVVMPIAYQYNPELVLVSAGFDACIGDPLGGCLVTPELYGHLTHWLSSLANGRIILSLEGGYNINSISHAMAICTKTLLGDPLPMLEPGQIPCTNAVHTINNVLKTQKQYWTSLAFNLLLPKERILPKGKIPYTKEVEQQNDVDTFSKHSEAKIALEEAESEKLELKLPIDKNCLNLVTEEEILKLQNEVENIKIKNSEFIDKMMPAKNSSEPTTTQELVAPVPNAAECARNCVNDDSLKKQGLPMRNPTNSAASSSSEQPEGAAARESTSLYDYLSDNLQALTAGDMFAVVPLRECPHIDAVADVPASGIDVHLPCVECQSTAENWVCLQCYTVHCARNINQHAMLHAEELEHPLTLSFSDLSVWCYGCEAYIDNPRLYAARSSVHQSKFNEELPWTYDDTPNPNTR